MWRIRMECRGRCGSSKRVGRKARGPDRAASQSLWWRADRHVRSAATKRLAGTVFLIRVLSAGLAYFSQVLLARWMGGSDYGIYVYVWTWCCCLAACSISVLPFPRRRSSPNIARAASWMLRGASFLGSRWMTFAASSLVALLLAAIVTILSPWIDAHTIVPLYIGCLTLPAFVVANTRRTALRDPMTGCALGLMPQFIVRQSLIIGFTAGAVVLGMNLGATAVLIASRSSPDRG